MGVKDSAVALAKSQGKQAVQRKLQGGSAAPNKAQVSSQVKKAAINAGVKAVGNTAAKVVPHPAVKVGVKVATKLVTDEKVREKTKGAAKTGAMVGGGAAAGAGGLVGTQLMALFLFLQWLKNLILAAIATAMNLLSALLALVIAAGKAVVSFLAGAAATVGSVFGIAIPAAAAQAIATILLLALGVVTAAGTYNSVEAADAARKISNAVIEEDRCGQIRTSLVSEAGQAPGQVSAQTEVNGKLVYSLFAGWGMSDTNIAGILGNWQHESMVDPTAIESIYDENHFMGPKKMEAERDFDAFVHNVVFPHHRNSGITLTDGGIWYKADDGRYYPGIGLGQWTGGRALRLLNFSSSFGQPWNTIQTQLVYMMAGDLPAYTQIINNMTRNEEVSVQAATMKFLMEWEGVNRAAPERISNAEAWFARFGEDGYEADAEFASSILAQAQAQVGEAATDSATQAYAECGVLTDENGNPIIPGGVDVSNLKPGQWTHPLPNSYFTSGYGWRDCSDWKGVDCTPEAANHNGNDFATSDGSGTVVSPTYGTITRTGKSEAAGYPVGMVDDEDKLVITFVHCELGSHYVKVGDKVKPGDPICAEGETGNASNPHLHFQINAPGSSTTTYQYHNTMDPAKVLTKKGVDICPPGRDITDACRRFKATGS